MAEVQKAGGGGGRALEMVSQVRTRFVALPPRRRQWLVMSVVGALAVVLLATWYAGRPDWRVLFSGLEGKDVAQVSQELAAAGIPFQATPDGAGVEVPAELLDKARMEVAAKGMPASGRLGFELFDKPNWVGSEFDERVNYQRALEGELEHTIATLGVVRSARVHLVLPRESMFAAEKQPSKASVVLKLKKASLPPEQSEGIRNLVAGAVEGLTPEAVTLLDADGRVNLQPRGGAAAAQGEAEAALEARLIAMLEPLAGAGNVRATVNVLYDQTTEDRVDDVYDPQGSVALSTDKKEQGGGLVRQPASGIPGTASNAPAAAPAGALQGSNTAASAGTPPLLQKEALPVYPGGATGPTAMKEESGTFAVSRHTVHVQAGPGRIQRVSAAVVVNDRPLLEPGKPAAWRPRSTDEMHRLELLAQSAVGFDAKRGDVVTMENVGFSSNQPELKAAGMDKVLDEAKGLASAQPGLLRTAMLGGLGLILVLFVLRPVAGQVVATLREPVLLERGEVTETRMLSAVETPAAEPAAEEPRQIAAAPVYTPVNGDSMLKQVSEHIRREPAQSTRLLEAWIGATDEGS